MATQAQLEIISPSGEIEFFDLDPAKGITNIGRHPENDVVLDSPGVAPFHAVLDHRQKPYQIVLLSQEGETTLGVEPLPSNLAVDFHPWDTLEIDGYAIVIIEGEIAAVAPAVAVTPDAVILPDVEEQPLPPEATVAAMVPQKPTGLAVVYPDRSDNIIVTELSDREWIVDVEQTANGQLTIVNGGDIVATFEVKVKGLDKNWVAVAPHQVNLNEGERATVAIAITPPRHPTSYAGVHPLVVVVTSPNHPGRSSQIGATLVINPYFDFAVGELSPKKQNVSWQKRTGQSAVTIVNKGNSEAVFQLEGEDEERVCSFEFLLEDELETVALAKRAEVSVPPGETAIVPVDVTPPRRLVGLRGRTHSLMLTTALALGDRPPRSLLGQLISRPLVGPFHIALIVLAMAALVVFVSWPRIHVFAAETEVVAAGEGITLFWRVSPLTTDLQIEDVDEPITGPQGEVMVSPKGSAVTYRLRAKSWLSQFISREASKEVTVLVIPLSPAINKFTVDKKDILRGDLVTVNWSVSDAEEVIFRTGDAIEIVSPEEHSGQRVLSPTSDTLLSLEASNSSATALKSAMIRVSSPKVRLFEVQPSQIAAGQSVTITWDIAGVESVAISPLPDVYPSSGSVTHWPDRTTDYLLTASAGDVEVKEIRHVEVTLGPTPTPVPQAPIIEFFTLTPGQVAHGNSAEVQLAWSILGETTDIKISSLNSFNGSDLKAQDIITVRLDSPTLFVLTALNGDLSASQTIEFQVLEPTPEPDDSEDPSTTPKPGETPTATPIPAPTIAFFKAEGDTGYENNVFFLCQEQGSDGPVNRYQVDWNSKVVLSWEVQDADTVTLNGEGQPATGDKTVVITNDALYQLTAQSTGGTTHAYIQIEVIWPNRPNKVYLPLVTKR